MRMRHVFKPLRRNQLLARDLELRERATASEKHLTQQCIRNRKIVDLPNNAPLRL